VNTQPEALRLAAELEDAGKPTFITDAAAAELRRLHQENVELREAGEMKNIKTWRGLTDKEVKPPIKRAMQHFGFDPTQYSLAGAATIGFLCLVREIEAKLKEKNT
jgi:hypothetical protein